MNQKFNITNSLSLLFPQLPYYLQPSLPNDILLLGNLTSYRAVWIVVHTLNVIMYYSFLKKGNGIWITSWTCDNEACQDYDVGQKHQDKHHWVGPYLLWACMMVITWSTDQSQTHCQNATPTQAIDMLAWFISAVIARGNWNICINVWFM